METTEKIIRKMRSGAIPKHRHDRELLLNFANRFENAVKLIEADRDNWRKQALDEDARTNAMQTPCNQQKMREALLMVKELFDGRIMFQHTIRVVHEAVNAALVEPPRNCDMASVVEDPHRAWLDDKDNWGDLGNPKKEIDEWLLSKVRCNDE